MRSRRPVSLLLGAVSALVTTGAASQVQAQSAVGETTLEDVVVTAQRREERLQDVPIAVTAITSAALAARGLTRNEELVQATPSLNIGRSGSTPLIYLRGVGTQSGSPGAEPSVPLYIDGVVVLGQNTTLSAFNNVERIEVLRGPQGTLFGRNATGGLVQVITRDPTQDASGEARVGFGSYRTLEGSFYGTTGFGETLAANLAANYRNRDEGFGVNTFNGEDVYTAEEYGLRSKLLWTPADATRISLAGDYVYTRANVGLVRSFPDGTRAIDGVTTNNGDPRDVRHNIQPKSLLTRYAGILRVEQDVGFARLLSITAYQKGTNRWQLDLDGTASNIQQTYSRDKNMGWTQEVQLQSAVDSPVQWVLGGFYLNSRIKQNPQLIFGSSVGAAGFLRRHGTVKTESYSGFGQATVPLGQATKVTAGLRWTHDRKNLAQANDTIAGPGVYRFDELSNSKLTYRLVLDQKLAEDVMVYGSVSRGYKAGEFNLTNPANPPIRPETLDAYEVGMKSQFLDRRLRFNVTAFWYDYKDMQLSQQLGSTTLILNATKARIKGGEAELEALVARGLTLSGGISILHGRYGFFPGAPFSFNEPWTCATATVPGGPRPTDPSFGNQQCFGDATGNKTVRTPPVAFNLAANYQTPLAQGTLRANAALAYTSRFYFEPDNRLTQGAYTLVNGDLGWTNPSEAYTLRFWVRNLFNTDYRTVGSASAADQYGFGEPRTVGADLTLKF